ncbi:MAG: hypothetical protein GX088_03765 [Clostridia bacterium]|nr:hypothetical protein [Clostridia bacterium]
MASAACPKCGHEFFEMREVEPMGPKTRYEIMFVFCAKCGAAIGTVDCINLGKLAVEIREKLDDIEHKIDYLIR